jgi:hypothetical protein
MKGRDDHLAGSRLARHGAVGARSGLERCHSLRSAFGQDKLLAELEVGPTFGYWKDRAKRQSKETKTKATERQNQRSSKQIK